MKSFHLVPATALMVLAASGVLANELDRMRTSGEVVLAHREASLPFSYLDANKEPVGYSVDLCLRVVEALRKELKLPALKVKWLPVTSASRIPAIAEKRATLECGSTTNNAERRKQVDYTIAHFISSSRFLVKADRGISQMRDLIGKRVISTKGTTNVKALYRLNDEHGLKMQIAEASDHAEAFGAVQANKADAFAMDDVLLYGLRANSSDPKAFAVVGKPMTIEPYAIMMPKGEPELKAIVDREIRRIIFSGEINVIYKKWFESAIPPNNINLDLPMPYMLRESFKYPSDKVGDLN